MLVEAETLCEIWKEEVFPVKTSSQLYHLSPIGIGTPLVESLTSYISRLAAAHSVRSRTLVTETILPLLERSHLYQDGYPVYDHLTTFWKHSSVLNGTSATSDNWVQILEQLTQCNELRFLTFLPFANAVSYRGLMRPNQAWCSLCYEEWKTTNRVIYQPLLWQLSLITVCSIHQQQLHTNCPYCKRTFSPLMSCAQPGYCSHCKSWLGTTPERLEEKDIVQDEKQYWINTTIGELVATIPALPMTSSSEVLQAIISAHVNNTLSGNYSLFARHLHVHRRTAWEWGQGTQIPQLNAILLLSSYFNIPPINLLTSGSLKISSGQQQILKEKTITEKRRYRRFESDKVRKVLEDCLRKEDGPPPSMREVAQCLHYDASHLYKHFPHLCQAIAARYRSFQKKQRQHRLQHICDKVEQVVLYLTEQGCVPSERQVQKYLQFPGVLKEFEVRMALHTIRRSQRENL